MYYIHEYFILEVFFILSYKISFTLFYRAAFSLIIIYIYILIEMCCEWIPIGRGYNVWDIFRYHVIYGV